MNFSQEWTSQCKRIMKEQGKAHNKGQPFHYQDLFQFSFITIMYFLQCSLWEFVVWSDNLCRWSISLCSVPWLLVTVLVPYGKIMYRSLLEQRREIKEGLLGQLCSHPLFVIMRLDIKRNYVPGFFLLFISNSID